MLGLRCEEHSVVRERCRGENARQPADRYAMCNHAWVSSAYGPRLECVRGQRRLKTAEGELGGWRELESALRRRR